MPHIFTLDQRSDLIDQVHSLNQQAWPTYMLHGQAWKRYWHHLFDDFPEYQSAIVDDSGRVIGAGHTVPLQWDGTITDLPPSWDATLQGAVDCKQCGDLANALAGLAVVVATDVQGQGVSLIALRTMKDIAARMGFASVIVPVRPVLKPRYPLTPMERYARWTRNDGQPFDPWLRTHTKIGGEIIGIANESKVTIGTVSEWESWANMAFPETGTYILPDALDVLNIDRERDLGRHAEPNVWLHHRVK